MFACFGIYSYLCTRHHAVHALRGCEGVGQDIMEQRLTTLCFWFLEPEKFNTTNQEHCRVDATGGIIISRQCAEARVASSTLLRVLLYTAWASSVCLLVRFSQDLRDGRAG
jgi:hypothetical protein